MKMKILVLTDNQESWYVQYGKILVDDLKERGFDAQYIFNKKEIINCDVCFLLSCVRIVEMEYIQICKKAIVVHGSDLPKGKGFSPIQWQVLEGVNNITITLLDAAEKVDSGDYYFKQNLLLEGHELLNEIRQKLALVIHQMVLKFLSQANTITSEKQIGFESFYPRRTKKDDKLNVDKTLSELFSHFRIADNDNYPLYFELNNHCYILKIEKA